MAHHAGKRHSEFSLCVQALARLHPAGLADDWADKLAGQGFFSRAQKATFEHYMQVCIAHTRCLTTHVCQLALDWQCGAAAVGEGDPLVKSQTLSGDARASIKMPTCAPRMCTVCMADAALMMPAWPQVMCTILQVVLTTIDPSRRRQDLSYDAYEYTVCSHMHWLTMLLCFSVPVLPISQRHHGSAHSLRAALQAVVPSSMN